MSFYGDWYKSIVSMWFFQGRFHYCSIMWLLTVSGVSQKEPFLCMNNCLSESQLYDREYLFFMSMPNEISVSSSLLHITNVWKNLILVMQWCKVALPSEDIDDLLAVLRCTAASWYIHLYRLMRELLQSESEPGIFSLHALLPLGSLIKSYGVIGV